MKLRIHALSALGLLIGKEAAQKGAAYEPFNEFHTRYSSLPVI